MSELSSSSDLTRRESLANLYLYSFGDDEPENCPRMQKKKKNTSSLQQASLKRRSLFKFPINVTLKALPLLNGQCDRRSI